MQGTHSETISVDDNQQKCCFDQQAQLKQLRLIDNDVKAHFQALCCYYANGLAMDLLLVEIIKLSFDCVVIKYLISMKIKTYPIERQRKVLFDVFCLIILSRESDYLCVYLSRKYAMRTASFVPRSTWFVPAMGLNWFQQSMRTSFT